MLVFREVNDDMKCCFSQPFQPEVLGFFGGITWALLVARVCWGRKKRGDWIDDENGSINKLHHVGDVKGNLGIE